MSDNYQKLLDEYVTLNKSLDTKPTKAALQQMDALIADADAQKKLNQVFGAVDEEVTIGMKARRDQFASLLRMKPKYPEANQVEQFEQAA